jgi:hypothetical protein
MGRAGLIRGNVGASSTSPAIGFGTPGIGVTHGFGPYRLRSVPAPVINAAHALARDPNNYDAQFIINGIPAVEGPQGSRSSAGDDLTRRNPNRPLPLPVWGRGPVADPGASGDASWSPAPDAVAGNRNKSQAAVDASAPAAPIAPSDHSYPLGGLPGLIAEVAGIDPRNPTQFAPPPLDDGLRGLYRDDPVQPWTLQRRR